MKMTATRAFMHASSLRKYGSFSAVASGARRHSPNAALEQAAIRRNHDIDSGNSECAPLSYRVRLKRLYNKAIISVRRDLISAFVRDVRSAIIDIASRLRL